MYGVTVLFKCKHMTGIGHAVLVSWIIHLLYTKEKDQGTTSYAILSTYNTSLSLLYKLNLGSPERMKLKTPLQRYLWLINIVVKTNPSLSI